MPGRVAIAGYGHFGRALGELLNLAGRESRIYDPGADVPAARRAQTPEELVSGAEFVALCVPIAQTEAVLEWLSPALTTQHTVFDVGSVKLHPETAMARTLGDRVPWVATHPLFGPTSLALGQRPNDVVVCPNPVHPKAVARVCGLWRSLDCQVIEQDAETHDRTMAQSHALTFFIAKGLLDAQMGLDLPFAPPSFRAVAQMLDTVRSDAGHLFSAIHRQNPFAPDARTRFLHALEEADAALSDVTAVVPNIELQIPESRTAPAELREVRDLIDELDVEILDGLRRRAELSRRAKLAKDGVGMGVRDSRREGQLLAKRRQMADAVGLDADGVDAVFTAILRLSRKTQVDEDS